MNSTGQHGEKTLYRIILLLVVGLTAFSSAMKELNQLQQFGMDASRLVAGWSASLVPDEVQQTVTETRTIVTKSLTCENKELQQSAPSVELPWLDNDTEADITAPEPVQVRKVRPAVERRSRDAEDQVARLQQLRRLNLDPVQFEVRILSDQDAEADAAAPEIPLYTFKARSRKHSPARINPREHEIFLKSLNRSINLRIAG
jgi:hypothetical protein